VTIPTCVAIKSKTTQHLMQKSRSFWVGFFGFIEVL
jgi:hypothetical protein